MVYLRCLKYGSQDLMSIFNDKMLLKMIDSGQDICFIAQILFQKLSFKILEVQISKRDLKSYYQMVNKIIPGNLTKLMTIATKTLN